MARDTRDIGMEERDTFFHLSLDMLCIADLKGRFLQLNGVWQRTLGHSVAELTAVPFLEFVHPEDSERTRHEMERLERGEDVLEFQNRYRCRDGSYRWLSWKAHAQVEKGLIYAVARDVTAAVLAAEELAESERRFRTLADSAPVSIWMTDGGQAWTYSNRGWRDFTGWSEGEAAQHGWEELLHPNDRRRCRELYREAVDAGRAFRLEGRLRRADNAYRWMLLTGVPRFDREGGRAGFIGTVVDITERKREEDQRLRQQVQRAQKLESLSQLSSGVAHDFSNLLMSILGHVDVVSMQMPAAASFRRNVEAIQEAATRAAELCTQLLTYAGKGGTELRPVSLGGVALDMLRLLEVSIPRTVTIESVVAPELPPVLGDAGQLGQVVMNLVKNAAEALGAAGGHVRVRTGVTEIEAELLARECVVDDALPGGTYVTLDVEDDGPGMDEATLARVFDPFFSTKLSGRGFGLAVVLGIVRAHHGAISVRTEPGRGTTVRVLLPASGAAPAPADGRRVPGAAAFEPVSVLIVDGEGPVLETTRGMLEKLGCEVRTADGGAGAAELLRSPGRPPELLLLDLDLEGGRGPEVAERLRAVSPGLAVLYLGADPTRPASARGSFLQKPFSTTQLVAAMQDALGRPGR